MIWVLGDELGLKSNIVTAIPNIKKAIKHRRRQEICFRGSTNCVNVPRAVATQIFHYISNRVTNNFL